MVGQIQHSSAVTLRARMAQAREQVALARQRQLGPRHDQVPREPRMLSDPQQRRRDSRRSPAPPSATQTPPPLPLTSEEAELCERLQPVLAKPPRRTAPAEPSVDTAVTQRMSDVLEAAPDLDFIQDAPLEPPPQLPLADAQPDTAAVGPRTISWQQRSKRARWRSRLGRAGAWLITITIITATVSGSVLAVFGLEKSAQMVAAAQAQLNKSLSALSAEAISLKKR